MSWHSSVESAIGMIHPTEVHRRRDGRYHVLCESCDAWITYEMGLSTPELAEIVAKRHRETNEWGKKEAGRK